MKCILSSSGIRIKKGFHISVEQLCGGISKKSLKCFTVVDSALKMGDNVLKHTIEEKNASGLM